jgi:hypothetical protein
MSVFVRLLILSSIFVTACIGGEDELSALEQAARRGCIGPTYACGSNGNSPKMDNLYSHDFSTKKNVPNAAGFELYSVQFNKQPQTMRVFKSEVEITDTATGVVRTGSAANGTQAVYYNKLTSQFYTMTFWRRGSATFWAKPGGTSKSTPTYFVQWKLGKPDETGEYENICSNPPLGDQPDGMDGESVVLFETDRIHSRNKTVYGQDATWWNIGCVGHALAKMHLVGHTQAAQNLTAGDPVGRKFTTNVLERQTFLKMITGDYCGTGDAFTVAGQPLEYADHRGWMKWPTPLPALEARWNEKGAMCLNIARIDANPTPEGISEFNGLVVDAINSVCSIPTCTGSVTTFDKALWISGNP